MSKKPVVFLNRYRRTKSLKQKKKKYKNCLPGIKNITGNPNEPGLIELKKGRLSQVIKLEGSSLINETSELESLTKLLGDFIFKSGLDLQLVVTSRNLDINRCMNQFKKAVNPSNEYIKWYAEYTEKWTTQIAERSYVSKQEFYIVVSKQKKTESESIESTISSDLENLLEQLSENGLRPALLTRSQIRKKLFSSLKLSRNYGIDKEPAEAKSPSTIANVDLFEHKDELSVDGTKISTYYLSDLPRYTDAGWLSWLLWLGVPFTLSLHLSNPKFIDETVGTDKGKISSKSKTIELTGYLTTRVETGDELAVQEDVLGAMYEKKGVLFQIAEDEQFDAWLATLPTGQAKVGITHELYMDDATDFWPFFTTTIEKNSGLPFGYSIQYSKSPQFLELEQSENILVVGRNKERRFINSLLAVRLMCTHKMLCLDVNNEYKNFADVLGPSIAQKINCHTKASLSKLKENGFPAKSIWNIASPISAKQTGNYSLPALKRFSEACNIFLESTNSADKLFIFLPELSVFLKNKASLEELFKIYKLAKSAKAIVVSSGSASDFKIHNSLAKQLVSFSNLRIVVKQEAGMNDYVQETFLNRSVRKDFIKELDSTKFGKSTLSCVLYDQSSPVLIEACLSPMDYWIYAPGRKAERKRRHMEKEIRKHYPNFSDTDVARQCLYYLGLVPFEEDEGTIVRLEKVEN